MSKSYSVPIESKFPAEVTRVYLSSLSEGDYFREIGGDQWFEVWETWTVEDTPGVVSYEVIGRPVGTEIDRDVYNYGVNQKMSDSAEITYGCAVWRWEEDFFEDNDDAAIGPAPIVVTPAVGEGKGHLSVTDWAPLEVCRAS